MNSGSPQPELKSILTATKVGELTLDPGVTLSPIDSLSSAVQEMRNQSHGSAVVYEDGKVLGILTERDLLRLLAAETDFSTPLKDVMTAGPQTVKKSDRLIDAIRLMDSGGYRRVPVVDSDGAPVGIVDVKTVVHFLVEHFPSAVYNIAPLDKLIARDREGA